MKRHGLWQWHKALNAAANGPFKWWTDEDLIRSCRVVEYAIYRSSQYGGDSIYAPYTAIVRCAYRAMRRFKLQMNVANYAAICEQVGKRMHAHNRSIYAAISYVDGCRGKAAVFFESEFDRATTKARPIHLLVQERKRRLEERKRREDKIAEEKRKLCCVCKKRETSKKSTWLHFRGQFLLDLDKILIKKKVGYGYCLCWSCWMHLRKMTKTAQEADDLRIINNRNKRKIYESTKNNARASGCAG